MSLSAFVYEAVMCLDLLTTSRKIWLQVYVDATCLYSLSCACNKKGNCTIHQAVSIHT